VITATVVAFPLMYKTAQSFQIDASFLRAARTLGASEATVFWRVILPLSWELLLEPFSLLPVPWVNGATLMLAGNIPGQTQTIPVAIYFAVEAGDMKQASVWVLVILAISLTVLTAVNFWSDSRRSVAVKARGEEEQGKQGQVVLVANTTPYPLSSNLPKSDQRGLIVDIQKQLPGFV